MGMSTLDALTREEVASAFAEAKVRFARADADLKNYKFPYPPKAEDFEKWKELRRVWDERDEELQAAREDLRDFDRGNLKISEN
jgi:hypothetical protein